MEFNAKKNTALIRLAIADDHPLVINGLHHVLGGVAGMEIVGSYRGGRELLDGLARVQPDVLLLDIQMPDQSGDELAGIISQRYPGVRILALTNFDDVYYIKAMLANGVLGYVLKTAAEEVLIEAILAVNNNREYLDPALLEKTRQELQEAASSVPVLSRREKEVLQYIAADLTSQQIADGLFISKRTVDNHRTSLLMKLGVKNSPALIKKAIQLGLID